MEGVGGFLLGLIFGCFFGFAIAVPSHDPTSVERRAKAAYTQFAESKDWIDGTARLSPWQLLSETEREAWRRPLRSYSR